MPHTRKQEKFLHAHNIPHKHHDLIVSGKVEGKDEEFTFKIPIKDGKKPNYSWLQR